MELIPSTCQFSNVRTTLTKPEWDKIRFISYEKAGNKCEICKGSGKNQGYKHNVECHEIWKYDDKKLIQKLVGLISLCPTCHQVKHIGRAIAIGKTNEVYNQLSIINNWSLEEVQEHIDESFKTHKERSKYEWKLDISLLAKEPYSIKLKKIKNRKFKIKKYKKKRKIKTTTKKVVVFKKKVGKLPPKVKTK